MPAKKQESGASEHPEAPPVRSATSLLIGLAVGNWYGWLVVSPGMPSALVVGIDPHTVPGMDGNAMRAALDQELARFGDHVHLRRSLGGMAVC
ncbi:hypothetical protein ACGFWI_23620 [Streptomyces sp. NPDC048434]|uniref:hypothetical protein n=1 Tax=Streptomyces sp. NPDC048434 TaxID=3365549 RepID=UPI00371C1832